MAQSHAIISSPSQAWFICMDQQFHWCRSTLPHSSCWGFSCSNGTHIPLPWGDPPAAKIPPWDTALLMAAPLHLYMGLPLGLGCLRSCYLVNLKGRKVNICHSCLDPNSVVMPCCSPQEADFLFSVLRTYCYMLHTSQSGQAGHKDSKHILKLLQVIILPAFSWSITVEDRCGSGF